MTPDELERERAALQAELDAGNPWTDELQRRLVDYSLAARQRMLTNQTLNGRFGREIGVQVAALFAASGITDAMFPPGTKIVEDRVYIRSESRGRIQIGTIDYRRLLTVTAEHAERLEAETVRGAGLSKGRAAQLAEADRKRAEVHRLAAQGLSQRQVAVKTGYSRRTVQTYWPAKK